jgi:hypothetical protein
MIIYEVTAKVGEHLSSEYERFMIEQHVPDVLATGAFKSASLDMTADGLYRVCYIAEDREALESYLNEHSTELRKAFSSRFSDGVEVVRKEWETIRTWKC